MKKLIAVGCVLAMLCSLPFALGETAETEITEITYEDSEIDLDLSAMSGTIVYSQIYNLMYDPASYVGKIIRMSGWYDYFEDSITGLVYCSCIVPDATACCAAGIEFVWAGDHPWPDDYPEPGSGVTVTGRLETYLEGEYTYLHLVDAQVVWDVDDEAF